LVLDLISKLFARSGGDTEAVAENIDADLNSEHRTTDRDGTFKVVSVTYPSGYVRKGVVVDRSETGVRVRFHTRGELPEQVILSIEAMAGRHRARVVWQDTHDAGFAFEQDGLSAK
jgi:hypothetical protein